MNFSEVNWEDLIQIVSVWIQDAEGRMGQSPFSTQIECELPNAGRCEMRSAFHEINDALGRCLPQVFTCRANAQSGLRCFTAFFAHVLDVDVAVMLSLLIIVRCQRD